MGNLISRAIIANEEGKAAKADIIKIDELKAGDIFLLCSDGVIEAWQEHKLTKLLCNRNLSLEQKTEIIREQCDRLSKDNNTAYLIEIEDSDTISTGENKEINWLNQNHFDENYQEYLQNNQINTEEDNLDKNILL